MADSTDAHERVAISNTAWGASEVDEVLMRRQPLSHRSDNAMEQQPDGGASALMAKVKVASSDPAVRDMKEVCAPPVHDQSTDNC